MLVYSAEHTDECQTRYVRWNQETGESKCPECEAMLEPHEVDEEEHLAGWVADPVEESDGHPT